MDTIFSSLWQWEPTVFISFVFKTQKYPTVNKSNTKLSSLWWIPSSFGFNVVRLTLWPTGEGRTSPSSAARYWSLLPPPPPVPFHPSLSQGPLGPSDGCWTAHLDCATPTSDPINKLLHHREEGTILKLLQSERCREDKRYWKLARPHSWLPCVLEHNISVQILKRSVLGLQNGPKIQFPRSWRFLGYTFLGRHWINLAFVRYTKEHQFATFGTKFVETGEEVEFGQRLKEMGFQTSSCVQKRIHIISHASETRKQLEYVEMTTF